MTLSQDAIAGALGARPARYYDTIGSTNDAALDWLRDGAPTGAVVLADEQTKGRGRLGRAWHAPPGTALMVSVILRPDARDLSRITMLGAVAVAETLEQLGVHEVGIKWPNDVRVAGRKICGVLPEAVWNGTALLGVVLGMGLNVRVDFTGIPLHDTAVSLEAALGRPVDRLDLLARLLNRVDDWSQHIGTDTLYDAWKGRLTMLHQKVSVSAPDGVIEGSVEAVDADGALLIRTEHGALHRVIAGDLALGERGTHGH